MSGAGLVILWSKSSDEKIKTGNYNIENCSEVTV